MNEGITPMCVDIRRNDAIVWECHEIQCLDGRGGFFSADRHA